MYESFGAREVENTGQASFRVFIPDNTLDPAQFTRGTVPSIASIWAVGSFQSALGGADWTPDPAMELKKAQFTDPADGVTKGWLYELVTPPLPEGFYEYKYYVTFESGQTRHVCDPCTRYGGSSNQNSGFVIGGPKMDTVPLSNPLPLEKLVIYELMIDDFTANLKKADEAPMEAIARTLDKLLPAPDG